MALVSDWGFFVKPDRQADFRRWLRDNEQRLAELAPKGYEYLGTYLPVWRDASESSEYHQLWRYGAPSPPDLRAAAGDSGGAFTELARDFLAFVDESRSEEEGFRLYRSVGEPPEEGGD